MTDFNPDELDAAIYSCLQRNKQNINKEKLRRIHKDCNIMYNSVNVLCGRQGSGKTFTSMKEAIKISMLSPETHLHINEGSYKNINVITRDSSTCNSLQR